MKDIDAEYYGYRDEDDGVLVPLEQEYEKEGMLCSIFSLFSKLSPYTSVPTWFCDQLWPWSSYKLLKSTALFDQSEYGSEMLLVPLHQVVHEARDDAYENQSMDYYTTFHLYLEFGFKVVFWA